MRRTARADSYDSFSNEPWQFIVLRSQNLGLLRPEKSWRPIVTLEVDGQHKHEVVLGTDGQNPNQRETLLIESAHHQTQLKIDIWHKSQSKAKSRKRRHLVASTSMPLGEAMKKQGTDPHLELRLSGIPAARKKSAAQKHQQCASLVVRLRAPRSYLSSSTIEQICDSVEDDDSVTSSVDKSPSDTLVTPVTGEPEDMPPWASGISEDPPLGLRRRRKPKGYCINSEEEPSGESDYCSSEAEPDITKTSESWNDSILDDESLPHHRDTIEIHSHTHAASTISIILPSLLPRAYVSDNVSVASGVSLASTAFDTFTYHRDLREAQVDSDFDRILARLIGEWYYTGASLLSIAAVDTTVFGFSPDSIIGVDGFAKRALTISSISSAIGLAIVAWFIFIYSGADVRKFQTLSLDVYGTYFFFALSSRLPLLALLISVLGLVSFLSTIAWGVWPTAVLVMCGLAGVLISLQFIVYGCHRFVLAVAWMIRGLWLGVAYMWRRLRSASRPAPPAAVVQAPLPDVRQVTSSPVSSRPPAYPERAA